MSVQTTLIGTLYKPDGTAITSGNLVVTLSSAFISIDGYIVKPFRYSYAVTGALSLALFATENTVVGSSYTALAESSDRYYTIEYDSGLKNGAVATYTTPIFARDGYFKKTLSVPHVSDTPGSNTYAFSNTGTPVKTAIIGSLYNIEGEAITTGRLFIKPQAHFTAIDGTLVAPFEITYTVTGPLSFSLFATENTVGGSSYTAVTNPLTRYVLEYDPDSAATTVACKRKDGYFKNTLSIPHVSDTPGSNIKNIKDIYSSESTQLIKKYGYGNILDNDNRILTAAQKALLIGGDNAGSIHTHSGTNLSYLKFDNYDYNSLPAADHVVFHYQKGVIKYSNIPAYEASHIPLSDMKILWIILENTNSIAFISNH